MNSHINTENWTETKTKIKARFGKLTDDSIESVKGDLDQLSGKLQTAYGYAKEQAEKELAGFRTSLQVATEVKPQTDQSKPVESKVAPAQASHKVA